MHKTANVLNKLPKSQQLKAKRALQEIWMAETKEDALAAFDIFIETWGVKYDKAVECLTLLFERHPLERTVRGRALITFQRQQGLQPTGQIHQRTASALGLSTTGWRWQPPGFVRADSSAPKGAVANSNTPETPSLLRIWVANDARQDWLPPCSVQFGSASPESLRPMVCDCARLAEYP